MTKKFKQPLGVSDVLTKQCFAKNKTETNLLDLYSKFGYKQIDTPILEYSDLYSTGVGKVNLKKLFKLTDYDGSLLVLRPDMTMPISRIVSTKFSQGKYKICYRGKTFRFLQTDGLREFSQVGIELMGEEGIQYDCEVISLAIESLLNVGIQDFIIDIGHVDFFKGLLCSLNLTSDEREELASLVESKDFIGEELFAKRVGLSQTQQESLLKIPMLFGGDEVFEQALQYCVNEQMKSAVERLVRINDILKNQGYEKYISYDLSLVGEMSYYSGIVFKGMCEHVGASILSGGRYDHLCDSFDRQIPSVGFAIDVDRLLIAMQSLDIMPKREKRDAVVGCSNDMIAKSFCFVKELVSQGLSVSNLCVCSREKVMDMANVHGTAQAYYIENGIVEKLK